MIKNDVDITIEDEIFAPKRNVNNKLSWKIPHIIGAFYSVKMDRVVEYESLAEYFFYLLLELDVKTQRYYVQPTEIEIASIDKDGNKKAWMHVPDVLVFRTDAAPLLIQIKGTDNKIESERLKIINNACLDISKKKGWNYKVIFPKKLDKQVLDNIRFLSGFIKKRLYYDLFIDEVKMRIRFHKTMTVYDLANTFSSKIDLFEVIPVIYYLIANGAIYTDLKKSINTESKVYIDAETNFECTNYLEGVL